MHPTISYDLAHARIADLRRHAQRDTLARAARRARPDRRGHAGSGRPGPDRRVRRKPTPRTVLAIASLGAAVAFIDATIVNIAFPDIVRSFPGTSVSTLSWVLNAYNIVFAAFLMAAAGIADLLGRRRVFVFGLELFTVGSLLCAIAPSADALIAFRVVQALGAAFLVPSALALVLMRSRPRIAPTALRCCPRWARRPPASAPRSAACSSPPRTGAWCSWSTSRSVWRRHCWPAGG